MKDIFTITSLGVNGRFGNQLFQYITGKALARKFNCELQVPADWELRKYFDIPEKPISVELPRYQQDKIPKFPGWDLYGYWQFQEAVDLYSKQDVINWLPFHYETNLWINQALANVSYRCIHKRRGDYITLNKFYATVSDQSYIDAINEFGFAGKDFITVSDNKDNAKQSWWEDFVIMSQSSVLFRANSTFSYWAGILGKPKQVFAPLVEAKVGLQDVKFVEGNWPRCTDCVNHGFHCRVTDLHLKDK